MTAYHAPFRDFFARTERAWGFCDDDSSKAELLRLMRNFVELHRDFVMQYPVSDDWNGGESFKTAPRAELYAPFSGKILDAYFHIPFCQTRCTYCNFHIVAGAKSVAEFESAYLDRLEAEVAEFVELVPDFTIRTFFVGGGTPSFLSLAGLAKLMGIVRKHLAPHFEEGYEFTFEGNPDSFDSRKFKMLKEYGANRVSLGVQTFDASIIARINRTYSAERVLEAFLEARAAGFENINIDMMYGLPGQSIQVMRDDLDFVLKLAPEHLTYYPLYYYEASVLGKIRRTDTEGKEAVLDLVYDFYRELRDKVDAAGYYRYGREYFSKDDRYRHLYENDYVSGMPLAGFGHSAYSYNGNSVFVRDSNFATYMAAEPCETVVRGHNYDAETSDRRKMVLGSRNRVIPKSRFENLPALVGPMELAKKFGFVTETDTAFELTERGLEYQEVFTHLFV